MDLPLRDSFREQPSNLSWWKWKVALMSESCTDAVCLCCIWVGKCKVTDRNGPKTSVEGEILSVGLTHTYTACELDTSLKLTKPSAQSLTSAVTHTDTHADTEAAQQWGDAEQRQSDGVVDNTGATIVFSELRPGRVSVCVSEAVTKQLQGTSLEIKVCVCVCTFQFPYDSDSCCLWKYAYVLTKESQ